MLTNVKLPKEENQDDSKKLPGSNQSVWQSSSYEIGNDGSARAL